MSQSYDAKQSESVLRRHFLPKFDEMRPVIAQGFLRELKNEEEKILQSLAHKIAEQAEFQHFLNSIPTQYEDDSRDFSRSSEPDEREETVSMEHTGISSATTEGGEDSIGNCSLNPQVIEDRRISFDQGMNFPGGIPTFSSMSDIDEQNESLRSTGSCIIQR